MKVEANGIALDALIEGKDGAPWVTFSHALGTDRHLFDEQAAYLADDFRILRYDTRGHGRSDAPPGPYSFDMLIADLIGLWDALSIPRSHLVGLSLGGMTALGTALSHPDRLASIAVCDARADNDDAGTRAWNQRIDAARAGGMAVTVDGSLERWFTPASRQAGLPAVAKVSAALAATPVEGYAGCAAAIIDLAYLDRLSDIAVPTLFVVGAEDPSTPPSAARGMHERVAGSQYVEIPGAAHLANLERPELFDRAIGDFLRAQP